MQKTMIGGCGCPIPATAAYARKHHCDGCGEPFCERHLFLGRVDESNLAITLNSGLWCAPCWSKRYALA